MFKKIKKIRTKILLPSLGLMLCALTLMGVISAYLNFKGTLETLDKTLNETVAIAADLVSSELKIHKTVLSELAGVIPSVDEVSVRAMLDNSKQRHGYTDINRTSATGMIIGAGQDVSTRDFFTVPRDKGEPFVSNPIPSADGKSMNIYISAPITVNGRFDGIVYVSVDAKLLSNIVGDIAVGDSGTTAIIDKNGTTIGYGDYSLVLSAYNTNEEQKNDPQLERLAALERDAMAGNSDFGQYSYGGINKLMTYTPVPETNGWSIYVTASQSEFLQKTNTSVFITICVALAAALVATILLTGLARSISRPIIEIEQVALEMSRGNYDVTLTHQSSDELGALADSMRKMLGTTKTIILDTARGLDEIARGNFNITPQTEYIGVFKGIETAIIGIITGLSSTMVKIKEASEQVSSGSEQVSNGAQALAQGATEQASSVEELSATLTEVSEHIIRNAQNSKEASDLAVTAGAGLNESNEQMQAMMHAMEDISSSSSQIGKIIKTIEDIAFQTNILALNAAVEAARAGAAGKGFAVVADEVRNLASKSAEAAKQTNVLIDSSVKSVANGVHIADATAKSLVEVVAGAQAMSALIVEISKASAQQSIAISQINDGISQISGVVQTNSATAEESAAASEELSGQAAMMKSLIAQFQINQSFASSPPSMNLDEVRPPRKINLDFEDMGNKY